MRSNYDFPFRISEVADLLPLTVRRRNDVSMYVDCPFCNDKKKGKLNINFSKNTFRCNINEEHSGGMLELYARYHEISRAEAYREICEALRCGDPEESKRRAQASASPPSMETSDVASLEVRHQTYSMLFSGLILTETHRQNLLKRGLTEEQIRQQGYKSTPAFGYTQHAARLLERSCTLMGVPGFYVDENGEWTVNFNPKCSGIIIPVMSIDGRIQGAQIRLDRPIDGTKYIWFSTSEKNMGASSGSPVHFVGDPQCATVFVTEGGLKGNIAHSLSGRTFLCNAGVNQLQSLRQALQILKGLGLKRVYETNDMDKDMELICHCDYKKSRCEECEHREEFRDTAVCPRKEIKRDNIRRGCAALLALCVELGLDAERLTWDKRPDGLWAGNWKGIDDFELHKKQRRQQLEPSGSES